jgi:hypothetical protein
MWVGQQWKDEKGDEHHLKQVPSFKEVHDTQPFIIFLHFTQ